LLDQSGGAAASGPTQAGLTLVQVRNRIDELERRAAEEGVREGAPVDARMALARFLLQNDFAAEALGALRIVGINQGALVELDPEYRLMRGAANVMMGRVAAAQPDLSASALANNPSAALWRGYGAFLQQDWPTARSELERGAGALEELSPAWRGRFQLALARATLELGDLPAAEAASNGAMGEATDQSIRLAARLIQARLLAARSDLAHALPMLDQLSQVDDEEVAVQASVEAISLRRQSGVMRAVDAIEPLEALRFRWRGDATELEVVGMLGDVYSEQGRWREALGVMRTVADRYPNNPAARQLRADMSTVFERLFLDGEADQLQPIEALGLFYEFSDLTPVGPNGDRIVRLLAGRLVNVDLLEQAAQLLQHQVDERVNGMNKAQVAADLAAIYLMDHKPDQALVALASSRQPNMPQMLLADRRILEARALLDLGRLDGAVELVERDRSEDAQRVRADAAWRSHDWDRAAVELRSLLAMRDHAQPLDEGGRQAVLRQAVALTLDGNDDAVRALYREYAGDMANTPEADAFEVVASGISADGAAIRDVARAVARTDLLDRFLQRLRTRMTADANTPHPAAPSAPNAPNAPAAPPPPAAAALPTPNNRATPPAASSTPTA
jgi:tetratricopeptide (TPR) repeat protein